MKKIVILIFLIVNFLVANSAIIGNWYTTDGQKIYQFVFKNNGVYNLIKDNQILQGNWKILNNNIVINLNGTVTKYSYKFQNGYLILIMSNKSYIMLGKNRNYFQNLIANNTNTNTNINTNTGVLTDKEFLQFLQNFYNLTPDNVYIALTRMSKSQQSWIPVFKAWYEMYMFKACQGSLAYKNNSDAQACAYVKQSYNNRVQLLQGYSGSLGDPWSKAKSENSKLTTFYLKKLGKISGATYNSYINTQQNIYNMQNQTTNTIINNLKPEPCVNHYEQGTNAFLGCY